MLLALNEYLKAFKESPNDNQIIKKIALVYFDLKKFSQSFKYYEKIETTLNDEEKEKMMLSLVYEADLINKTNIKETSEKIKNLNVSKDEKVYYINAINCTLNFHDCKKIF
jgi:tetratricopeptide (TPR) repeat protein